MPRLPRPSLARQGLALLPALALALPGLPALAVDFSPPRLPADAPPSLPAAPAKAAAARAPAAARPSDSGPTGDRREPRVETRVIEDRDVRIEERRVRGAVQSLTVTPRGAPAYEVAPTDAGRHFGDSPSVSRTGGERTWRLLSF